MGEKGQVSRLPTLGPIFCVFFFNRELCSFPFIGFVAFTEFERGVWLKYIPPQWVVIVILYITQLWRSGQQRKEQDLITAAMYGRNLSFPNRSKRKRFRCPFAWDVRIRLYNRLSFLCSVLNISSECTLHLCKVWPVTSMTKPAILIRCL